MRGLVKITKHGWIVLLVVVLAFLVVPSILVIFVSFNGGQFAKFPPSDLSGHWYATFFTNPEWLSALGHSAEVSLGSAALSIAIGTPASVALVRGQFIGQGFLRSALIAPMVMPTIVLGIGLYQVFAFAHLIGSIVGLMLAYTVLGVPIVILTVSAGLQSVGEDLERAARSLGAAPVVAFVRVTLPMIMTSVLAGGLFVVVAALSEVVIASLISGTTAVTLPLQMWLGLRFGQSPVIAAASTVLLGIVVVILALTRIRFGARRTQEAIEE